MPTKTETLLNSLKINKLTRSQFLTAKAADEVDLDNEFYMTGEVLGEGDMLKEVYDKDGDGIVDNAEKVNGLTVLTAVPANAKFTDTTYAVFKGATSSTGGGVGLVPAPSSNQQNTFLRGDGNWASPSQPTVNNSTITITQNGVSKGAFGLNQSNGLTIPLTDTTYSQATSTTFGLVKIGYEASDKNYPVSLSSEGKAFVKVPWTDTNTTYSQATSGTLGLIKIGYAESGKNYPVELNSSGQAFVHVPWTDSIANNPTITITQNGTSKGSFTLNQTSAETIALTDTTYSTFVKSGTGAKAGLVPAPSTTAGTTKYLREDGTWTAPPNTTYANFKAATASIAGGSGLVPAPAAGKQTSYLRGDGTWAIPSQPTVNNATITVKQAGAVKGSFTLNQSGAATIELTDNNTTYSAVSTSAAGLAPKLPGNTTTFLRGDGTWSSTSFSGGTVSGATTFSSNVTVNGEFNYDGGLY